MWKAKVFLLVMDLDSARWRLQSNSMEIKLFIALLWATACKPSDGGKDWMTGTLFASRRAILEI